MSYENLSGAIGLGEFHLDATDGCEIVGEEFMDCCYWDEALKKKMRQTVTPRAEDSFSAKQTKRMIEFAWFENPSRVVRVSQWDEAAKEKMRKPIRTNGNHTFDDLRLKIMIGLAGS